MRYKDGMKKQDSKFSLEHLKNIRIKLLDLNQYPEIGGDDTTANYPETKIQKAYSALLWQIDEEIRRI